MAESDRKFGCAFPTTPLDGHKIHLNVYLIKCEARKFSITLKTQPVLFRAIVLFLFLFVRLLGDAVCVGECYFCVLSLSSPHVTSHCQYAPPHHTQASPWKYDRPAPGIFIVRHSVCLAFEAHNFLFISRPNGIAINTGIKMLCIERNETVSSHCVSVDRPSDRRTFFSFYYYLFFYNVVAGDAADTTRRQRVHAKSFLFSAWKKLTQDANGEFHYSMRRPSKVWDSNVVLLLRTHRGISLKRKRIHLSDMYTVYVPETGASIRRIRALRACAGRVGEGREREIERKMRCKKM